jgi:hypothetical protein
MTLISNHPVEEHLRPICNHCKMRGCGARFRHIPSGRYVQETRCGGRGELGAFVVYATPTGLFPDDHGNGYGAYAATACTPTVEYPAPPTTAAHLTDDEILALGDENPSVALMVSELLRHRRGSAVCACKPYRMTVIPFNPTRMDDGRVCVGIEVVFMEGAVVFGTAVLQPTDRDDESWSGWAESNADLLTPALLYALEVRAQSLEPSPLQQYIAEIELAARGCALAQGVARAEPVELKYYEVDECDGSVTYLVAARSAEHCLELLAGHGALSDSNDGDTLHIRVLSEEQARIRLVWPDDPGRGDRIHLFDAPVGSVFSTEV